MVTRLVYAALIEIQGTDYFASPAALGLDRDPAHLDALYLYARPAGRRGPGAGPCLPLLAFGSSAGHVLVGNGFTVLLAVSCGLGAFALVTRERRSGSLAACALLCLGVATFSVALAFLAGVAIYLIAERDWRRLWIPAAPAFLDLVVVVLGDERGFQQRQHDRASKTCWRCRAWMFQLLGYALAAVSGLAYDFGGGEVLPALATTLAVAGIALGVWWLRSNRAQPRAGPLRFATFVALSRARASSSPASSGRRTMVATCTRRRSRWRAIVVEAVRGRRRRPPCSSVCTRSSSSGPPRTCCSSPTRRGSNARPRPQGCGPRSPGSNSRGRTPTQSSTRRPTPGTTRARPSPSPGTARRSRETRRPGTWSSSAATERSATPRPRYREQPEDVKAVVETAHLIGALGIEPVQAPSGEAPLSSERSFLPGLSPLIRAGGGSGIRDRHHLVHAPPRRDAATTEVGTLTAGSPAILRLPEDEVAGRWVIFADGASFGDLHGLVSADLTIVIPAFNEREALPGLLDEIEAACARARSAAGRCSSSMTARPTGPSRRSNGARTKSTGCAACACAATPANQPALSVGFSETSARLTW